MLASLLPGLRELRAPLAAGYLWLLSAYLLIKPHVPEQEDAEGLVADLYSLEGVATAVGLGVAASFVAYLVGTLSSGFLNPVLRAAPANARRLLGRSELRPDRLSRRSWRALRNLVIDSLREVDSVSTDVTLAALVREEVPDRGRGGERGLLARVLDAVANELDLVKTRLLGEEVDLFSAVDRHQAEADFRLAVLPPLAVLAGVVTAAAGVSWVALISILVAAPVIVGLGRQAFAADSAASEVLVDALRLDRVASPTLERLAAAARRSAGLAPDAEMPPLRDRRFVIDSIVQELRNAVAWVKPLGGSALTDDARAQMRAASDRLETLEVYLPRAARLQEHSQRAQTLLKGGALSEEEVKDLEEAAEVIAELSVTSLDRPGQVEELVADEQKLRAAVAGSDPQQRRLAALALAEVMASTEHLEPLLELLAGTVSDPEFASPWLRRAFETAAHRDPVAVAQVSWKGARLAGANLAGLALLRIDLRDADLAEAVLTGSDLSGAQLHNSSLVGSDLREAVLMRARLIYTDLAGADLSEAILVGAEIERPLVKDLKLSAANLGAAEFDPGSIPWHLIEDWDKAELDPDAREAAEAIGGRVPKGPRILMLSWEAPPLVAGGSWTACWHLVRSLRAQGADVSVVVPWAEHLCERRPFGTDVEVVFAGIEPSIPDPYVASGGPFPPYLPYSAFSPYWWDTGMTTSPYYSSPYGGAARLAVDEFASWLSEFARLRDFALVHAHDWVTFPAARRAATRAGVPWIAHVHSTAADRRPDTVDRLGADFEREIEHEAVHNAQAVIAPSGVTERVLVDEYGAKDVNVIPNPLAREAPPPGRLGKLEARRTVFVGRLARQKAPDRFLEIAKLARARHDGAEIGSFAVFGDGEERRRLEAQADGAVTFEGAVPWAERDRAFEEASVLVVPSRSEPFGMVIAEAMQRGVPAIYSGDAGIGEVVHAGIPVDPANLDATVEHIASLLSDESRWNEVAEKQLNEIAGYVRSEHEGLVRGVWADRL